MIDSDDASLPAMEWLAAMCTHIPNRGEHMVKYYGYFDNVSPEENGRRKAMMMPSPASSNHRES